MKRSDAIQAFVSGFIAAQQGQTIQQALAQYEASIKKRTRRWFKKPNQPEK